MSVYRPVYIDRNGRKQQSKIWWYNFRFGGKKIQQSAKTDKKTLAKIAEKNHRDELERSYTGARESFREPKNLVRTVSDAVDQYIDAYALGHSKKSLAWVNERAPHVKRLLGKLLVAEVTEQRLRRYMQDRLQEIRAHYDEPEEDTGHRTVNMEIDLLARAIGQEWRILWPRLRRLDEPRDTGRALEADEQERLLKFAAENRSPYLHTVLRIALLSGMRFGEIIRLRWDQVDLDHGTIAIGRSNLRHERAARVKTKASIRTVPMPPDLRSIFGEHLQFIETKLGPIQADWFIFSLCNRRRPIDPTRPVTDLHAWDRVREQAGVECRFHDLRHTAYTNLVELGVPDGVIEGLMGHISKQMKDRYSHVRMAAMREAVAKLSLDRVAKVFTKDIPKSIM